MGGSPLTLRDPEGRVVDVRLLAAGTRAGLPSATFVVDLATWERIDAEGLLHADPTRRRTPSRPWDPAKPVEVEAVLDPVAAIDGADDLAGRLLDADPGDALRSTEAWWALSATQEVDLPPDLAGTGSLSEGVSFAHPTWLQDAGSVGLEEAWQRALELMDAHDDDVPLLDLVVGVLAERGWDVERPNAEASIVQARVHDGSDEAFDLYVRADEVARVVTIYAVVPPIEIPGERVTEVIDLVCRLNAKVLVGSFEAGAESGLVSFKTGIDVRGDRLSAPLLRTMLDTAVDAAERALPLVEAVASGERPAWDAVHDF
jgi:hypothetical protein